MPVLKYIARLFGFASQPVAGPASDKSSPADAMRGLRVMALTTTAAEAGIGPNQRFPDVYGVVMDLPISNGHTASVFALCDGNASLYTTSTFGILGGIEHASVRTAAENFVSTAQSFYDLGQPTSDFGYPAPKQLRFYLLGYDGVRVLECSMEALEEENRTLLPLFAAGQDVLTQLRLLTE